MSILRMHNTESMDRPVRFITVTPPDQDGDGVTDHTLSPGEYLTNTQIRNILDVGQEFSTTNKLILTLTPTDEESVIQEVFDIQNIRGIISYVRLFFKDTVPSPTGFERDCYSQIITGQALTTADAYRVEIEIPFAHLVNDGFERRGVPLPEFGFMSMVIKKRRYDTLRNDYADGQQIEHIVLVKTTLDPLIRPPEVSAPPALIEAAATISHFTSRPSAYENLHIPAITGAFRYNFYEVNEGSLLAAKRKNFNLKKISEIPKYIELNWTPAPISVTGLSAFEEEGTGSANQVPNPNTVQPDGLNPLSVGGRYQEGPAAQIANGFRIGGMGPGVIISVGGEAEEMAALFGGRSGAGRIAQNMQRSSDSNVPANVNIEDRDGGVPLIIGDDNTITLGLSQQEDLLLQDQVRNSNQPDAISGPNEFSRYIGYVLFKERYNPTADRYEPVDLLAVLDRRKNRIIDTKVAYGDTYRYKVRSVFKFVNVNDLPLFGDQDSILSRSVISTFDGGIPFRHAFYFDSKFSEPVEVTCVEFHRPSAPFNVQLFPDSKNKEIFITWNQKNPNKDVAGFTVFRKLDVPNSKFERLTNIPLSTRNNFYVDKFIDFDTKYIYAIQTNDIHDNISKLSVQYKTSIKSQDFWVKRIENKVEVHVNAQLELNERPPIRNEGEVIKFNKNVDLVINPLFGNLDREATYLLKILSLDTFFKKEVKLNFRTKIINHRSLLSSDIKFRERQAQIQREFQEAERQRFGLTIEEAQRRRDLNPGRTGFDE